MDYYLNLRHIICQGLIFAFFINTIGPVGTVQAQDYALPLPGVMVHLSPAFNPPILKGIKVHPDNPFRFDFILDKGDTHESSQVLKDESSKLIKYFLASLTIPEKDLWVNLSPYEKDRIVPESFGRTEMGRDLLAEDYLLKQITASLIYPEGETGKKFWKRVYQEAYKRFGTTNIPVNTFNKVWILPEKAVVYENAKSGTAYVLESKLKVMLEQDYLSLQKHEGIQSGPTQAKDTNQFGSQIVREIVIPQLTKEVNEDKNFAQLRQVYNSLILATWYKKKIKDSILAQVYENKNKVAGVNIEDPQEKQKIYERYLQAFKKGAYNYIKEEIDPVSQQTIPRKYFSGGTSLQMDIFKETIDIASVAGLNTLNEMEINTKIDAAMETTLSANVIKVPDSPEVLGRISELERLAREGKSDAFHELVDMRNARAASVIEQIAIDPTALLEARIKAIKNAIYFKSPPRSIDWKGSMIFLREFAEAHEIDSPLRLEAIKQMTGWEVPDSAKSLVAIVNNKITSEKEVELIFERSRNTDRIYSKPIFEAIAKRVDIKTKLRLDAIGELKIFGPNWAANILKMIALDQDKNQTLEDRLAAINIASYVLSRKPAVDVLSSISKSNIEIDIRVSTLMKWFLIDRKSAARFIRNWMRSAENIELMEQVKSDIITNYRGALAKQKTLLEMLGSTELTLSIALLKEIAMNEKVNDGALVYAVVQWGKGQPYKAVMYLKSIIDQRSGSELLRNRAIVDGLGEIKSVHSVILLMDILNREKKSYVFSMDDLRTTGDYNMWDFFKKLRLDGYRFPRVGYALDSMNGLLQNEAVGQRLLYLAKKGRLVPKAIEFIKKRKLPDSPLEPREIRLLLTMNYPQYLTEKTGQISKLQRSCLLALGKLYGSNYISGASLVKRAPFIFDFLNHPDLPGMVNPVDLLAVIDNDQQLQDLNKSLTRWKSNVNILNELLGCIPQLERLGLSYKSAVAFILEIISKGHRSDVIAIRELLSRQEELKENQYTAFLEELIRSGVYLRWKIKIIQYVSEMVVVNSIISQQTSGPASNLIAVVGSVRDQLRDIVKMASVEGITSSHSRRVLEQSRNVMAQLRLAMMKYILKRSVTAKEENLMENEVIRQKILLIISEVNSLSKLGSDWELMKEMMRMSLDLLFKSYRSFRKGDALTKSRRRLNQFLMNFSAQDLTNANGTKKFSISNKEIKDKLIRAGYPKRLWEEGIDYEVTVAQGVTTEDKVKAIQQDSFEMLEIAVGLGIKDVNGRLISLDQPSFIDSFNQAKIFMEALEDSEKEIPQEKIKLLQDILNKIERTEGMPVVKEVRNHKYRITIKKDFLNEATAGLGVPGCFAPNGVASEMPVIHAMEANAGFIQVYNEAGKQVANAVVVYTTTGAYVFPIFSYSESTYRDIFGKVLLQLTQYVPRVVIPIDSPMFEDLKHYGIQSRKTIKLIKQPTIFNRQYYDGGQVDKNGNLILKVVNPLVLTAATVKEGRSLMSIDKAMAVQSFPGGIDLNSDKALTVQNNGQSIKFHIDPAMLQQLQNAPGFVPVIISIKPMINIRMFLGLNSTTNDSYPKVANDNQPAKEDDHLAVKTG